MGSGLLFTLFTFPIHTSSAANSAGGGHMHTESHNSLDDTTSPLDHPSYVYTRPNVLTMQKDNRRSESVSTRRHIQARQSDVVFQIVFQYEDTKNPERMSYHSFAITRYGYANNSRGNDRYANSDYVKIDEYTANNDGTGYITLYLTAPYPSLTQAGSFSDYKQKLNTETGIASNLTLADMARIDGVDKNYHNINVCDNYNFAQELLLRLNEQESYEDRSFLQREVYIYRHEYGNTFSSTPEEQLRKCVQIYHVSGIEMELSDWKSSSFVVKNDADNPADKKIYSTSPLRSTKKPIKIETADYRNLMVGPRKAKFIFDVDEVLDPNQYTTHFDTERPGSFTQQRPYDLLF